MVHSTTKTMENPALDLAVRKKLYVLVRAHAGAHFRELERKAALPASSLRYHLNYLAKHGVLVVKQDGNYLRYFPQHIGSTDAKLLTLLRQDSLRNVLLVVLNNSGINHELIVDRVKLSASTVSTHLKKLEKNGMIVSKRNGRKTFFTLAVPEAEIVKLLVTYRESFLDTLVDRVIEMWDV